MLASFWWLKNSLHLLKGPIDIMTTDQVPFQFCSNSSALLIDIQFYFSSPKMWQSEDMASLLSDEDMAYALGAITVAYFTAELEKPKH